MSTFEQYQLSAGNDPYIKGTKIKEGVWCNEFGQMFYPGVDCVFCTIRHKKISMVKGKYIGYYVTWPQGAQDGMDLIKVPAVEHYRGHHRIVSRLPVGAIFKINAP